MMKYATNSGLDVYEKIRFVTALPIAASITLALFLLMRSMISTQSPIPMAKGEEYFLDIFPIIKALPLLDRKALPARTKEVRLPPPPPRIANQEAVKPGEMQVPITLPDMTAAKISSEPFSMIINNHDAQPLVRVEPVYPPRAAQIGREGTCEGVFDVTENGKPYNIRVTCSSPLFIRAATQAIARWKYNPKTIDGQTVPRKGIVTPFTFEMEP